MTSLPETDRTKRMKRSNEEWKRGTKVDHKEEESSPIHVITDEKEEVQTFDIATIS